MSGKRPVEEMVVGETYQNHQLDELKEDNNISPMFKNRVFPKCYYQLDELKEVNNKIIIYLPCIYTIYSTYSLWKLYQNIKNELCWVFYEDN